jgi:tetratricopeptide (TPR) repeat protein
VHRFATFLVLHSAALACFSQQQSPAPAQPVQEAEALIAQSNWKDAEAKLAAWLTDHPTDTHALFDAGYAADAQNHLDDAAAYYRRAIAADNSSLEAHLSLGLLLARQNKLADAHTELTTATTLNAGEQDAALKARAWRALARIDEADNPTAASDDLIQALKLSPETPEDTALAAELADRAGELDASEAAYRHLLAKDPASPTANSGLAHVLIEQKKFPEAETLLRSALEKSPDDPALTAQLSTVLAAQDKAEAIPLLQKLHDAHPTDAAISRMLAEVLSESGDAAASDQIYTTLLAASPNDPNLLISHGQNLIRQLHYADAFQVFSKATELAPSNPDGWSGLAFAASKTNRPTVTIHALEIRAQFMPENPSTYFLRATSYDTLHDRTQAANWYHRFLQAAQGKFPDQEWQAKQRLALLEKK